MPKEILRSVFDDDLGLTAEGDLITEKGTFFKKGDLPAEFPFGVVSYANIETISTGTYTITDDDGSKLLRFTAGCSVTIPAGLPVGFVLSWTQDGVDPISFSVPGLVTLQSIDGLNTSGGLYAMGGIIVMAPNVYRLVGDLI